MYKLNHLILPLKSNGWVVKYDSQLEDHWLHLTTKFQTPQQLFKLTNTLENFPLDEWQDIFDSKTKSSSQD